MFWPKYSCLCTEINFSVFACESHLRKSKYIPWKAWNVSLSISEVCRPAAPTLMPLRTGSVWFGNCHVGDKLLSFFLAACLLSAIFLDKRAAWRAFRNLSFFCQNNLNTYPTLFNNFVHWWKKVSVALLELLPC